MTVTHFGPCTFDGATSAITIIEAGPGDPTTTYLGAPGPVCDLVPSALGLDLFDGGDPLTPGTYCVSTPVGLTGTLQPEAV